VSTRDFAAPQQVRSAIGSLDLDQGLGKLARGLDAAKRQGHKNVK
jgi:hypothetical protein